MGKRFGFLLILLLLALSGSSPAAQAASPVEAHFMLLLPVPAPDQLSPGLSAEEYTAQVAGPVLDQLARLRAQGHALSYELLLRKHAIRVSLPSVQDRHILDRLQLSVRPADAAALACSRSGAQAVRDAVRFRNSVDQLPAGSSLPQETNPSIQVYVSSDGYGGISGYANPTTTVSLVLRSSAGTQKFADSMTSSSGGYYSFYPDWLGCGRYEFKIRVGDTVEVTADGATSIYSVVPLRALPDPATDIIGGNTAPGRGVEIYGSDTQASCDPTYTSATTTSDGAGNFQALFSPGFDRSVDFTIYLYDANFNYQYQYIYPPSIILGYGGDAYGYLQPGIGFQLSLKRGSSTVWSTSGTAEADGYYDVWIDAPTQAGDIVEVRSGGITVRLTVLQVSNLTADPVADLISGNLGSQGSGRTVMVGPCRSSSYGCYHWDCGCLTGTANSSGNFSLNLAAIGYDLRGGDRDYNPAVFDAEGNMQEMRGALVAPIIAAWPEEERVAGYWSAPGVTLTVVLRDGSTVKDVQDEISSEYDASISEYFVAEPLAGDSIDVGDGVTTITVDLPNLTAWLDVSANTFSGVAPAGAVLDARYTQYGLAYASYCEQVVADGGGHYSSNLGGLDVLASGSATAYYTTTNGQKVCIASDAQFIEVMKEGDSINGYVPQGNLPVTITLYRLGAPLEVVTDTSSIYGYYYSHLISNTIQENDVVEVQAFSGSPSTVDIPLLTLNEDVPGNRVYGETLPNALVEVLASAGYDSYSVLTQSDASGHYEVDFTGALTWDCLPVTIGAGCFWTQVTYYDANENEVWMMGPPPPDVTADIYEPDNSYSEAKPYTGPQDHTFDTFTDTDWISFTVSPAELSRTFFLQVLNVGRNAYMNMYLYLYDTDGTTVLADDYGTVDSPPAIYWSPAVSGTYYLEVEPLGSWSTVDCGSTYQVVISSLHIYLPLIITSGGS